MSGEPIEFVTINGENVVGLPPSGEGDLNTTRWRNGTGNSVWEGLDISDDPNAEVVAEYDDDNVWFANTLSDGELYISTGEDGDSDGEISGWDLESGERRFNIDTPQGSGGFYSIIGFFIDGVIGVSDHFGDGVLGFDTESEEFLYRGIGGDENQVSIPNADPEEGAGYVILEETVAKYDIQTGDVIWESNDGLVDPFIGSSDHPILDEDILWAKQDGDPNLLALDKETGDTVLNIDVTDDPENVDNLPLGLPISVGDILIFDDPGFGADGFGVFDKNDQEFVWIKEEIDPSIGFEEIAGVAKDPAEDVFYCTADENEETFFFEVDVTNGDVLSQSVITNDFSSQRVSVLDIESGVYYNQSDNTVAVDVDTGDVLWERTGGLTSSIDGGATVINGGIRYGETVEGVWTEGIYL